MKYVLTESGNIKIGPNGRPLVLKDGKEIEIDALGANDRITAITNESNERRKKLGKAVSDLEALTDEKNKLQRTVDAFGDDKKADADKLTKSINESWEAKQGEWETEKATLKDKLFDATTGVKFSTSEVAKTLILPANIAKDTFGKHFRPDGTAVNSEGNVILSTKNPGKPAGFDESLEVLINEYPNKDEILRSTVIGGGGHEAGGSNASTPASDLDDIRVGLPKV